MLIVVAAWFGGQKLLQAFEHDIALSVDELRVELIRGDKDSGRRDGRADNEGAR